MLKERVELIPLWKVKKTLNISWPRMMEIVRSRELRVFNVSRERIDLKGLGENDSGLRVRSDDLDEYIDSIMISGDDNDDGSKR